MVLGTGLGGLAERLDGFFALPSVDTGFLPRSTATGHAGRVASGSLAGVPLVVLQGRVHGYEGFTTDVLTRGVDLLAELGVQDMVLLTNTEHSLVALEGYGLNIVGHKPID